MRPRPRRRPPTTLLPSRRTIARILVATLFFTLPETGLSQGEEGSVTHRARPGDTVPRLSWFYRVRADAIRAANPLLRSDELAAGQIVVIPLASTVAPVPATPAAVARALPIESATPPPPRAATVVAALAPAALPPVPQPPVAVDASSHFPPAPARTTVIPRRATADNEAAEEQARDTGQGQAGGNDFLAAARRLAAQRISYNGSWTPPGQRSAWTMDCSNTARWLYREAAGVELPRTASDQYETLRAAGRLWETPRDDAHRPEKLDRFLGARLQPGDLLFWENTYRPVRSPDITHVMIFLGRDAAGRLLMAGSQRTDGVSIYRFDPHATKGGYSAWFGLVRRHGRFVAYGRPLEKG